MSLVGRVKEALRRRPADNDNDNDNDKYEVVAGSAGLAPRSIHSRTVGMAGVLFDEFWHYPEISGQASLLLPGKRDRNTLMKLIEAGDTAAIEQWIAKKKPVDLAERLIRLGIPAKQKYYTPLFDEIQLGTRSFMDGPGTVDYILSRRVGRKFRHRVINDGAGTVEYEFSTDKPLTKDEFDSLTTYPTPWEEEGFDDEVAESEVRSVWD